MSQDQVIAYLQKRFGEKYTAEELQLRLDLGTGVYENLKRLRPNCKVCLAPVEGSPANCNWCGFKMVFADGVRCVKAPSRRDSRRQVFFYWWEQ